MAIKLDYYHSTTDFVRYLFYRVPKVLFEAVEFRGVSFDARMFFIFLLDRANLSAQNGWIDETGRIYIFFTMSAAMFLTGYGHNKVLRLFAELEKAGLIERVRQGLGRPMKIYVKNLFNPTDEAGNPVEYQRVSLSPSEAGIEGQMDFLADMDAAEMRAAENESQDGMSEPEVEIDGTMERTAADQTPDETEAAETVPEAENTLDADSPAMWDYYAEIGFSPEEAAEAERRIAAMSPKDAAFLRSLQMAEYTRLSREHEQYGDTLVTDEPLSAVCGAAEASAHGNVDNVENVDNFSTMVENRFSEASDSDAFGGPGPLLPSDMGKSGLPENGSQDFRKPESNQTKKNNNNFSNKNPSNPPAPLTGEAHSRTSRTVSGPFRMNKWVWDKMDEIKRCREYVRLQISYEDLCASNPLDKEELKEFVELIVGVLCSRKDTITVNREPHPVAEVQAQFERLDREHIQYVLDSLGRSKTEIQNPRGYILTSLYNAPNTIAAYYDARVRHDMAQPSWYETPYSRRAS